MESDLKSWLKLRLNDEERYNHSLGVEQTARELAVRFEEDEGKAALAGLIHDNAKCLSIEEMLKIIDENNLPVSEIEKKAWKAIHAPVGAYLAEKELKIKDQDILNAIRFHTIGRIGMSKLEKIIYLADKIEPNRENIDFVNEIKKVLDQTESLNEAILMTYGATIKSLVDRELFINTQTVEVWNYLITTLQKKKTQ